MSTVPLSSGDGQPTLSVFFFNQIVFGRLIDGRHVLNVQACSAAV